jgi:hypothetical protein
MREQRVDIVCTLLLTELQHGLEHLALVHIITRARFAI